MDPERAIQPQITPDSEITPRPSGHSPGRQHDRPATVLDAAEDIRIVDEQETTADEQEISAAEQETRSSAQQQSIDVGLPWFPPGFNRVCRAVGRGYIFAMDSGHPIAGHFFIDYQWTEDDKQYFEQHGSLPKPMWDKSLMDHIVIPLCLMDAVPAEAGEHWLAPVVLKPMYWTKPRSNQQCLLIMKSLQGTGEGLADFDVSGSSMVCLPTEHTKLFDSGVQEAGESDTLMAPFGKDDHERPFDTAILQDGISIERNCLDARSDKKGGVLQLLLEMVHSEEPVVIRAVKHEATNPAFDPKK